VPGRLVKVFVPTAVSSFFTVEGLNERGEPELPLQLVGARGGGFKLALGTTTVVRRASGQEVVSFNRKVIDGTTTHKVLEIVRDRLRVRQKFHVTHEVPLPWGCGFGTSASTAFGAAVGAILASGRASTLKLPAQIAHEAEIICHTGLGTVGSLYGSSGCGGLITRAGGPGICELEPFTEYYDDFRIVATSLRPRAKKEILTSKRHMQKINRAGLKTLERILERPSSKRMLKQSRTFAEETGLADEEVLRICDLMERKGAIAATQNMVGEAAHCIVKSEHAEELARLLRSRYPSAVTVVSGLYQGGALILH
jgi:pantoate kinase